MMKEYKRILVVTAIGATLLGGALMSLAYNTDSSSLRNSLSTASTNVTVVEAKYDALPDSNNNGIKDMAEDMVQGREITKDPTVRNDSTLDMYCFAAVDVPIRNVMTVESAPQRVKTQLFSYDVNGGWKLLEQSESATTKRYLYGYTNKVAPGKQTGTLFDKVKFADVVEGEIPTGDVLTINITGYAIQAPGFNSMDEALEAFDWNQPAMTGGH